MKLLPVIFKRQLVNYFTAPITYLSIAAFLMASAILGFHTGKLLEQSDHDLYAFFKLHPWLYLLLIPILSAQLWSDERDEGSIDFINTLPVTAFELVVGKFLAAWTVSGLALVLTWPIVITVNYLGSPDNSLITAQFIGSWLLAGGYLSAGCFICALTHRRLAIFSLTLGLLLATSGLSSMLDSLDHQAPIWIIDNLISLTPSTRLEAIDSGILTLHDTLYFISMIFAFLAATTVTLKFRNG